MPHDDLDTSDCPPEPIFKPFDPLPAEPAPPIAPPMVEEDALQVSKEEEEAGAEGTGGERRRLQRRARRRTSSFIRPHPCHRPKPRILSLLLHGPRLAAIVSEEQYGRWWDDDEAGDDILRDNAKLTLRVYDASDVPADGGALALVGEKELRGDYDSARAAGERGFVITTSYLNTNAFAKDLYRHEPRYCGLNATAYQDSAAEVARRTVGPFVERMIKELDVELDGTCGGMFRVAAMQSGDSDEDTNHGTLLSQFVRVLSFDMSADFADKEIPTHVGGAFSSGWLSSVYASQAFVATMNVGK